MHTYRCVIRSHALESEKHSKHWRLSWFRYETFITFLTFRFSTRGEKDTIFTMLTVPSDSKTHGTPPRPNWPRLGSNLNWPLFSKYPRIPAHRFRAWRHSHPQSYVLSGVFIMTSVIVTSSPLVREHLPSMCALN